MCSSDLGYLGNWRGYRCMPTECGEIDYYGVCDGDTLYSCGGRGLRSTDCTAEGQICSYVSEEEGYDCQPCLQCGGDCVDPATSIEHCGGCNKPCALDNALVECIDRVCELADCEDGYENADGDASNGCGVAPPDLKNGTVGGTIGIASLREIV